MVYDPIPKTQHRPIGINVYPAIRTQTIPFRRRFNFNKANWELFATILDSEIQHLDPRPDNYEKFAEIIKNVSRRTIPRGCRQHYIPGLSNTSKTIMERYKKLYDKDPFSEETVECGKMLMQQLSTSRQEQWIIETLEKMDMTHSSKIAWNLIKKTQW
jgi:hypothetical protein